MAVGCGGAEEPSAPDWPAVERTHEPWTRWWWMGSAVTDTTVTHLLNEYDEVGIGGVEVTPIYGVRGREDDFVPYLSDEWMARLDHTTETADSLGMGVDLANGTGWPFGGPQMSPEHAARRAVVVADTLSGGEERDAPLVRRSEALDQRAPLATVMAYASDGRVQSLTDRVGPDGTLDWVAPEGRWTLYAVFVGWTGQRVKRSAPGGQGYVMDHLSTEALDEYLARFDQVFAEHGRPAVRAYFNDSYEVYGSNWTPGFFEAFEDRQGYDLRRHLPALHGDAPDSVQARVWADYRETLDARMLRQFAAPWTDWTHQQDARARYQAHGSPGNLIDFYAAADIPETETFYASDFPIPGLRTDAAYTTGRISGAQPDPLLFKLASSGAHLSGDSLVASETATWLGEHFRIPLSLIKPEVDQLFTAGVNHIFYHGTPYSPPDARWPGWLFYASTHVAPSNTIWRDLPGLNRYIARTQSFLQRGVSDNDVLLYFPVYDQWQRPDSTLQLSIYEPDWFYDTPVHTAAQTMRQRGYTFDYVSDRFLRSSRMVEGRLQTEGGRYELLVIPETRVMPVETMERAVELARNGATVVLQGDVPTDVPGLGNIEARRAQLRELREAAPQPPPTPDGVRAASVGDGRILIGDEIEALLRAAGADREPMADRGLSFTRRQRSDGYDYFITNLDSTAVEGWVPLGTDAGSAMLFDPMHERRGRAAVREGGNAPLEVYLQLAPGEATILRTFVKPDTLEGPAWPYTTPGPPRPIEGVWRVSFVDGGPTRPDSFSTDRLASWTEIGGPDARRFSGTARYEITFEASPDRADAWRLALGDVRESAHVSLNGEDLGRAWAHPFRVPVGDALRDGTNRLTIEVTNLMANRIIDLERRDVEWKRFYDINFVGTDYEPFDASGWTPMPSGLLGPVRLVPLDEFEPSATAEGGTQ
jgi:hypothetical protein